MADKYDERLCLNCGWRPRDKRGAPQLAAAPAAPMRLGVRYCGAVKAMKGTLLYLVTRNPTLRNHRNGYGYQKHSSVLYMIYRIICPWCGEDMKESVWQKEVFVCPVLHRARVYEHVKGPWKWK